MRLFRIFAVAAVMCVHGAVQCSEGGDVQKLIDRALAAGEKTIFIPKTVYSLGPGEMASIHLKNVQEVTVDFPGFGASWKAPQRNDPSGRLRRRTGHLADTGVRREDRRSRESNALGRRKDHAHGRAPVLGYGWPQPARQVM